MSCDKALRQEIRHSLDDARRRIRSHSGLYSGENLTRDVLEACDEMTAFVSSHPRLQTARRLVEDRCRVLAQATDRFAVRDPVMIAKLRAQAVAAIDLLQDTVVELHRAQAPAPRYGNVLRRRSL